jgi:hypothetical protein
MTLEEKLKKYQEKIQQKPLTSVIISITLLLLLLIVIPYLQVNYRGINNATVEATLENQCRATFAQILGGVAIGIGLYYTWRRITIAENNLKVSQEGQITERFTRAVDQLGAIDQSGNPAIEIRLGGIYALERIANESKKDYWPIMEILTAYVRKNSPIKKDIDIDSVEYFNQPLEDTKVKADIQAILTVIGERRYSYKAGEVKRLCLEGTNLRKANLNEANLNGVILNKANLEGASLKKANLKEAVFKGANLRSTSLVEAHLENAEMFGTYLELAQLTDAHLEGAVLGGAKLNRAFMRKAHLEGAKLTDASLNYALLEEADFLGTDLLATNLEGACLREAKNLVSEQLYNVKTLYKAELDEELERSLREKYPALFEEPKR